MSPKKRNKENKPLPERWRFYHGAYYYRVPKGMEDQWEGKKQFRLGKTLTQAYKTWSERINKDGSDITLVSQLMDRYILEFVPEKAPKTQDGYIRSIKNLRPVFGKMHIADSKGECPIKPKHAYQYYDLASKERGATSAKHDIQVLRHMLTKAVQWGYIDRNPLLGKQIRLPGNTPRDRHVEDWEIAEALSLSVPKDNKKPSRGVLVCCLYIRLKIMMGSRRTDILRLKISDLKSDGIHIQPKKTINTTGKRQIIEWEDEDGNTDLHDLVYDEILKLPPRRIGDAPLFVTRNGDAYIQDNDSCNAFDSIWQRYMDKVLEKTKVEHRFHERDLRAKTATDSDTLVEASERLGHSSTTTTNRIYRRKPTKVKPLILEVIKKGTP